MTPKTTVFYTFDDPTYIEKWTLTQDETGHGFMRGLVEHSNGEATLYILNGNYVLTVLFGGRELAMREVNIWEMNTFFQLIHEALDRRFFSNTIACKDPVKLYNRERIKK